MTATWDLNYYASNYIVTTGSSTAGYFTTTGASSVSSPLVVSAVPPALPPSRTALQWLDDEIEKTCALARA